MRLRGLMWGMIFCIPLWLIAILLVKSGIVAAETIIFSDLALLGMFLFFILSSFQNPKIRFPGYEVRHFGEHEWHKISEKKVMEILVDSFDPLTPTISRMLMGEEIIVSQEVYRALSR